MSHRDGSHDQTDLEVLKPQLHHNREPWEQLKRRKLQLAVVGFVLVVVGGGSLTVFVSEDVGVTSIIVLFVAIGLGFGYIEVRRLALFKRDLRERRENQNE